MRFSFSFPGGSALGRDSRRGYLTSNARRSRNGDLDRDPHQPGNCGSARRRVPQLPLLPDLHPGLRVPLWFDAHAAGYRRLLDVGLGVKLRFGTRRMLLRDVLAFSSGLVVELEDTLDSPVDFFSMGALSRAAKSWSSTENTDCASPSRRSLAERDSNPQANVNDVISQRDIVMTDFLKPFTWSADWIRGRHSTRAPPAPLSPAPDQNPLAAIALSTPWTFLHGEFYCGPRCLETALVGQISRLRAMSAPVSLPTAFP